jgi:predicted Fe-Mo cluster-binding NifX family protein
MIIAVTAQGKDVKGDIDPRFGRAKYFLLVDSETMAFEMVENRQNLNLSQGAGIQAAQNVANHQPEVVLTGNCGPKAFKTLRAAGIKVVVGVSGTIEDAVQSYLRGELEHAKDANVEGHW